MDGCRQERWISRMSAGAHARARSLQPQAQRLAVDTCVSGDSDGYADRGRMRTNDRDPQSLPRFTSKTNMSRYLAEAGVGVRLTETLAQ